MQINNHYYKSYTDFLKKKFGTRVQKLSVHAGLTCPNRDGTKGTTGCIYCLNEAFTPSYCRPEKNVRQQLLEGIEFHKNRYRRATSYIAYFQSYSNTYTDAEQLERMFEEALSVDGIIGISAGTRPDCINDDIAKLLHDFSDRAYVKIELGIESVFDDTLSIIKRGHNMLDTANAISLLNQYNIPVGGHMILGLPGEDKNRLMQTAEILSSFDLFSVKLHQLQIFRGTEIEKMYMKTQNDFHLFELNEYIDLAVDFAERLNPDIYIERFAGEVPPRFLVAPDWGMIRYDSILQKIIKRFEERNTFQGKHYKLTPS